MVNWLEFYNGNDYFVSDFFSVFIFYYNMYKLFIGFLLVGLFFMYNNLACRGTYFAWMREG